MNTQIRVYHNINVAMEVRMSPIYMNKFLFKFWEYNEKAAQGTKESHVIDCFLDIEEVGILINQIKTRQIFKTLKEFQLRKNSYTNRDELMREIKTVTRRNGKEEVSTEYVDFAFRSIGGSTPQQLAKKNQTRPDGAAESRNFKIKPSTKAGNVLLYAEKGQGQVNQSNGLIQMKKRDKYMQVSITEDQLYELATAMERSLLAIEMTKMAYFVEEAGLQAILNQSDKEARKYLENTDKKSDKRIATMSDLIRKNEEHLAYLEKLVIKLGQNLNELSKNVMEK